MSNESQAVSEATTSAVNPLLNQVDQTGDALKQSYELVTGPILQWAPNVIAMLVVLVVGYLLARLAGKAMTAICDKVGLQVAAERGGWIDSMKQVGIERTVPQIIGLIVFWLLMCVFLMAGCEILGLEAVSDTMQSLVAYIPKLFVAAVIVVVGLLLATFLRGIIATSSDRVGISYAQQLAAACYYILGLMVFIAAFEQLEIKFELLSYAILIGFAAVALGFGLAFGLGGRDVMSGILAGYYVRQRMHAGDRVNIAGFEGTIRDVGPVATIIETDEEGLLNRHSVPNIRMLNEAVR